MNICNNQCQPNDTVCKGCGRTEAERLYWNSIPEPMQQDIAERIAADRQVCYSLKTALDEISRLNSIIRELEVTAGLVE